VAISSVLLVATAFGLTIWRYEHAQQRGRTALDERGDRMRTEEAAKVFWHERESITEYLVAGEPGVLAEVRSLQAEFRRLTEGVADVDEIEGFALAQVRVANGRLLREFEFQRNERADIRAHDLGAHHVLIETLQPFEEAVLRPLRDLSNINLQREQAASSDAASASSQAFRVAFLGAIIALGAGLGFAIYAARLLRHVTRQTRALERTLAEREQAHQALEERESELRQAQKMEAVGRLAGGVAHDFNNILQSITGYSDLASNEVGPDQPDLRDYIDQVKAAATLATALTGKLLAFSHQQVVQPRVLDMSEVVEDLAAMLRPLLGERVELVLDLDLSGTAVEADPGQLEQIVMNLVINARDAMPAGGRVTITVGPLDLTGGTGSPPVPPGRYIKLSVSDTGTGMDEETMSRAFDPFFTTKGLGEGTGLGLATVHGIVTQSGGDMRITSAMGEGTTFNIWLPAAEAAHQATSTRSTQASPGRETVLVVEDVEVVRSLLRKILEDKGYEVITANGGAEALESVRTLIRPVDLLLTDMVMPGMGGRDLCKELHVLYPELRVIYMSGHTQDAALHHEAEAGEVDFLQKPFSVNTLIETVRRVLDRPTDGAIEIPSAA
jgi:signal transduction histidine kinase/ActR/RegA family two-component response regulator